jgi:hypothetical protein
MVMSPDTGAALYEGGWCFSSLLLFTEEDFWRVYPDDLAAVRQKYPHGWQLLCFRYGGQHAGYDVLDDGELRVRVRGAVIEPIPSPRFQPGDQVFAEPKQAVGVVRWVQWHLKRKQVYYSLAFGEQPSGRWYFEIELRLPSRAEPLTIENG